jgi:hypothetical protein
LSLLNNTELPFLNFSLSPHLHHHNPTNTMSVDVQTMPVSATFGQPLGHYAPADPTATVDDNATNTKSWYDTINGALADTLGEW